jgi:hypothetical protein
MLWGGVYESPRNLREQAINNKLKLIHERLVLRLPLKKKTVFIETQGAWQRGQFLISQWRSVIPRGEVGPRDELCTQGVKLAPRDEDPLFSLPFIPKR